MEEVKKKTIDFEGYSVKLRGIGDLKIEKNTRCLKKFGKVIFENIWGLEGDAR